MSNRLSRAVEAIKTTWQEGDTKARRVLGAAAVLTVLGTGFVASGVIGEISPTGDNTSGDYAGLIVEGSIGLAVGVGMGAFVMGTEVMLKELEEGPEDPSNNKKQ